MSILIHNETTEYLESLGLKRTDDFICPDTQVRYPCYKMSEYVNTVEGWNLYVKCVKNKDMQPFYEAKEEYYKNKAINRKEVV